MKKKLLYMVMITVFALSMAACGSKIPDNGFGDGSRVISLGMTEAEIVKSLGEPDSTYGTSPWYAEYDDGVLITYRDGVATSVHVYDSIDETIIWQTNKELKVGDPIEAVLEKHKDNIEDELAFQINETDYLYIHVIDREGKVTNMEMFRSQF